MIDWNAKSAPMMTRASRLLCNVSFAISFDLVPVHPQPRLHTFCRTTGVIGPIHICEAHSRSCPCVAHASDVPRRRSSFNLQLAPGGIGRKSGRPLCLTTLPSVAGRKCSRTFTSVSLHRRAVFEVPAPPIVLLSEVNRWTNFRLAHIIWTVCCIAFNTVATSLYSLAMEVANKPASLLL
jgi:hypothetical protein